MKPTLQGLNPSTFNTNGIGVLNKTIACFVTEQLNGEYSLTMEIAFDDPNFKNIEIGSVIAVQPNKYDPRQGFVVEHIGKPIDGICEIYATHIAQHRAKLIPVSPFTASSLANALTAMQTNSLESNPFKITTDKTSASVMKQILPHTFRELMGGTEGSLIDTYHGEFKYDNFSIQFLNQRGRASTDIKVLYGKNMTDFNLTEDFSWTDSITGVLPFWYNEAEGSVVGSIQYSPYKDMHPYARTTVLDCTDKFEQKPTAAQLNTYAATYVSSKGVSALNIEVAFDNLQFSGDRNIQIGDTVTVINSMYNINYKRRIVGYTFNVLLEEYEAVTIGALKATISDAVSEVFDSSSSAFWHDQVRPSDDIPTDVEHGGTAAVGTSLLYARADHKHAISVGNGNYNGSVYVGGQDLYVGGWDLKANLWSPDFTGYPTTPTMAAGDNTTHIASTEFVQTELGSYVPKTGGRFNGEVYFAQGTEVLNDNISGQSGTTGWVEICRITVNNAYIDAPIYIMLSRRGDLQPSEICIRFANLNGTDPSVQSLTVNGPLPSTYVAMVKESTSNWGVYVYKTGYNVINPLALHIPYYIKSRVTLTWLLTGVSVSTLSNATYATKQLLTQVQESVRLNHGTTHTITFSDYNTTALIYVAIGDALGAMYVYSYGYLAPIKTATGITATKSSDYLTITVKNTNSSADGILGVLQSGDRQMTIA